VKALQNEFTVYAFIIYNIVEESTVEHQMKVMNSLMNHIINAFKTQIILVELNQQRDLSV